MKQLLTPKEQVHQWIEKIIVGLNFCPFAKRELVNDTIHYCVSSKNQVKDALMELALQCQYLSDNPEVETTLIVYEHGFKRFENYLDLVDYANDLLVEMSLDGTYQIASFHPDYYFEDSDIDDAANYTNRAPFPILHLLREASVERVLAQYPSQELIPENNIALAREKGQSFFECFLKALKQQSKE